MRLDILVENLGRINYGPFLNDNRKGITSRVSLGGRELTGWAMYPLPFTDLSGVRYTEQEHGRGPVIRRVHFQLEDTADTYLDMRTWGKGAVWLNGRSLGRYWNIGPTQTVYVPGPWLRKGENELIIFEMLTGTHDRLETRSTPILDELAPGAASGP